jgi:di/tricarboxylate transporter
MHQQTLVFLVLAGALVLFILERWRYDVVALLALLTLTLSRVIPAEEAFAGFGHPAVITVAAILVVSEGLASSGVVDRISGLLTRIGPRITLQVGALLLVVSVCSAFMNNVGALALLMPVAIRLAAHHRISPSYLLMPLAFGSLLGGMTTLIGTPPNIIIGAFRAQANDSAFALFDFTPVGVAVLVTGVLFLTLAGWRLIPLRQGRTDASEMSHVERYTTELVVTEDSPAAERPLREVVERDDFVVVAILRDDERLLSPIGSTEIRAGDHLIVEVDPAILDSVLESTGFRLAAHGPEPENMRSSEIGLYQAVVMPRSRLQGRNAMELQLRARHGLNLLGIARQGARLVRQLKSIRFQPGDVLLLQGRRETVDEVLTRLGGLPLATAEVSLGRRRYLVLALAIFGLAILALVTRVLPAAPTFTAAALAMVLSGLVTLRQAYRSIDWSVIVLLGAMIPVGGALERTGGAELVAGRLADLSGHLPVGVIVAVVLVVAMFLSDIMNNAATAVLMAPIAVHIADGLGVSSDPFLMAVAVGASCAFLTPIGHQSNTLVLGPGGYRFGDYWRVGLPLEILITAVAVPVILRVWPLHG